MKENQFEIAKQGKSDEESYFTEIEEELEKSPVNIKEKINPEELTPTME